MSSISRSKFSIIPADSPMLTSLQFLKKNAFIISKTNPNFKKFIHLVKKIFISSPHSMKRREIRTQSILLLFKRNQKKSILHIISRYTRTKTIFLTKVVPIFYRILPFCQMKSEGKNCERAILNIIHAFYCYLIERKSNLQDLS